MKKPFPNRNQSFSFLIKLLSLKLCVPASYIVQPPKSILFVIWSFIKMNSKEIRLKGDQSAICTPKGRPWFFHISHYFSEEQLYRNLMYKLTTSVPSFQNDYAFYNNFWFMCWNCNASFYAFTFKANQHPASFFLFVFQPPSTIFYMWIFKESKVWAPSKQPMLPVRLNQSA